MKKTHPLVQKTKIELARLDKLSNLSWEEQKKFNSTFLPISVEPKLRPRALRFMNDLIYLLEANGHGIKFEFNRCHIEIYGQLTEINLRQKYFRKRIKGSSGYSTNTYEKSNKLEFQIGSYARKGWLDKETKKLEDYLTIIYSKIEEKSKWWADLRKRQRLEEMEREAKRKIKEEKARLEAMETEKLNKLITDAKSHRTANEIRNYLKALEKNITLNKIDNQNAIKYIEWGYNKADNLDPLSLSSKS